VDHKVEKMGLSFGALAPCPTVVVAKVLPGSWAEKEGIQLGDTILAVNQRKPAEMTRQEFMMALQERPLELTVSCVLSVDPKVEKMGLSFGTLAPCPTVVVAKVLPWSWAEREGVRVGDTILAINHRKPAEMTRQDFIEALQDRPLALTVGRFQPRCRTPFLLGVVPEIKFEKTAPKANNVCAACHLTKPRGTFSKAQLTKHRRGPKCRACVEN